MQLIVSSLGFPHSTRVGLGFSLSLRLTSFSLLGRMCWRLLRDDQWREQFELFPVSLRDRFMHAS